MPAPDVTAEGGAPRAGSPELAAVAGHPPHAPWLSQRPYRNSSRRVCQSGQMDPDACTERPRAPMKSLRGRTQCRDFRYHGHLAGAGPTCQPAGRGRAPDGNRDCVYWQLVFDAGAKAAQKGGGRVMSSGLRGHPDSHTRRKAAGRPGRGARTGVCRGNAGQNDGDLGPATFP